MSGWFQWLEWRVLKYLFFLLQHHWWMPIVQRNFVVSFKEKTVNNDTQPKKRKEKRCRCRWRRESQKKWIRPSIHYTRTIWFDILLFMTISFCLERRVYVYVVANRRNRKKWDTEICQKRLLREENDFFKKRKKREHNDAHELNGTSKRNGHYTTLFARFNWKEDERSTKNHSPVRCIF